MLGNLCIRERLALGFGGLLLLMAVVVGMVGGQIGIARQMADTTTNTLVPQIRAANALALAIDRHRNDLRSFISTSDHKYWRIYTSALAEQKSAMTELRTRLTESPERRTMDEIDSDLDKMGHIETQVMTILRTQGKDAALAYNDKEGRPLALDAFSAANRLSSLTLEHITNAEYEYSRAVTRLDMITKLAFAVALVLACLFVVATVRSVSKPTFEISQAADAIAGGDYAPAVALADAYGGKSQKAGGRRPRNELKWLAVALAEMAEVLENRELRLQGHRNISAACASTINLLELLNDASSVLALQTRSQVAAVYILSQGELKAMGTFGISPEVADAALIGPEGLAKQAAKSKEPVVISNIPDDARFVIQPGFGKIVPKAIACIPMRVEGQSIGVVVLGSLYNYDEDMLAFMRSAVTEVGLAASNALRHLDLLELAEELRDLNEELDSQNEELQAQNEEINAQNEEIQTQNEEMEVQSVELRERNMELESTTADLRALQSVTMAALSSLEHNELLEQLLASVCEGLHLNVGLIMTVDEERQMLVPAIGYNIDVQELQLMEVALGEGLAGNVGQSPEVIAATDPMIEPLLSNPSVQQAGALTMIAAQIALKGHLYGVALLGTSESEELSDQQRHLIEIFALRTAVAIQRIEAYEDLKTAEEQSRLERERLRTIIDSIPEGVVIIEGDEGRLSMVNAAALELYGLSSQPDAPLPEQSVMFSVFHPDGTPIAEQDLPLRKSLLTGEICHGQEIMIRQPSGQEIVTLCNTAPIRDSEGRIVSAVGIFGDITLIKDQERLLRDVYEQQRRIAETLQKSFLPRVQTCIYGHDIADAYVPAHEHAQVGGDFYDIIDLADGAVGLVIADVSGKGVDAAVYTAMAKYMLRGFAREDLAPARVLSRLNEAINHSASGDVFITLFYAVLNTRERTLVYANAGHEPPLIYQSESGVCVPLLTTGPVLGIMCDITYSEAEITLSDRDVLILYTDGITEARRGKEFLGQQRLETIIHESALLSATDMASRIVADTRQFAEGRLQDDVALMVIKQNGKHN